MNILDAIKILDQESPNPLQGLPEEIFLFITRSTPMINVDLLIKDERGRTLLSWRNDTFHEPGWHIPGGIIRYKEEISTRIIKVAENEIGIKLDFKPQPIAMNEIILEQRNRGHFISLLYQCFLSADYELLNHNLVKTDQGYLAWHDHCPLNLIKVHEIYREFI
ncbi:MAG: NUDIX domain-containing protein [Candidatus Margulisiibacteriota bacterium]|jgi:colanic acid biosynthesis protein WcaH